MDGSSGRDPAILKLASRSDVGCPVGKCVGRAETLEGITVKSNGSSVVAVPNVFCRGRLSSRTVISSASGGADAGDGGEDEGEGGKASG